MGGFGSAVLEFAADNDYHPVVKRLGIPDRIVEHGDQPQLHRECEYDAEAIKNAGAKQIWAMLTCLTGLGNLHYD